MDIAPIFSALSRHKTAATLIVLEIALTCGIICNSLFLIGDRLRRMSTPSGVAEDELVRIKLAGIEGDADPEALTREDLAALRQIPGSVAVANTNQIPFGGSSWNSGIRLRPNQPHASLNATQYFGSEELVETLGVHLVAGRDFRADEYVDRSEVQAGKAKVASVIITRAMAEKLYPGKSGLGESLYLIDDEPMRVIGVVDRLARPNEVNGAANRDYSMILPVRVSYINGHNYLLRVAPERREAALQAAVAALQQNGPNRIVLARQSFEEVRGDYYRSDRAMAWLLVGVCLALFVVTALGIVGLASFWVQQRTRQIGVRRALGASRLQILGYFQIENFILASLGIALGMALAYGINLWLMQRYELPRLPLAFLPAGAATLWALGQLAVLGPALRASAVPPAVATRSV